MWTWEAEGLFIDLTEAFVGPRGPSITLKGHSFILRNSCVGLKGPCVGLRGPCYGLPSKWAPFGPGETSVAVGGPVLLREGPLSACAESELA